MKSRIKIALPKGRLLGGTSDLLKEAGWGLDNYNGETRLYRLRSARFPDLMAKLFHEKDIPVQVAIGNYDLGICGLDWIEELMVRYPDSALVKIKDLGYGEGVLYAAARNYGNTPTLRELQLWAGTVRIASEYPNLAESLAVRFRLRRFSISPVWGGAEVYPPETAELAVVAGRPGAHLNYGLAPVSEVLRFNACLIANRDSWETRDLSELIASIEDRLDSWLAARKGQSEIDSSAVPAQCHKTESSPEENAGETVWLSLPDGHQQEHTARLLSKAGVPVNDYPSPIGNRRPASGIAGVRIKVIRPQDMPLQVANGHFDLAITGRDWLREHLYQFPSSPVGKLLDFKVGRVKIVAVISNTLPVDDAAGLRRLFRGRQVPIRVASEYVNIADRFARENHLGMYRIIPTWGASEAFLPEDADLLIENTETGQTLARHNLKIIDTLFESAACLIGRTGAQVPAGKQKKIEAIIDKLRQGAASLEDY